MSTPRGRSAKIASRYSDVSRQPEAFESAIMSSTTFENPGPERKGVVQYTYMKAFHVATNEHQLKLSSGCAMYRGQAVYLRS